MHAGPVDGSIRRIDFLGEFADKDTVSRRQFIFEVCLIRDDITGAGIDKYEWTIQRQSPRLAAVALGSLLELPEILCGQFGVDTGGLRHRARNEQEQAYDDQDNLHPGIIVGYDTIVGAALRGRPSFASPLYEQRVATEYRPYKRFIDLTMLVSV